MEFVPDRVEVEVNSVLELPLDVFTTLKGVQYSFMDCRNMPLNVTFTDPTVVTHIDGKSGLICYLTEVTLSLLLVTFVMF